MRVEERLLKYVSYWTTSDEECRQIPSSERQFELGKVLEQELRDLGLEKVTLTDHCYVYGLLPATKGYADKPAVGFISHMDTAPDFSGKDVKPQIIPDYDGNDVLLKGSGAYLKISDFPTLKTLKGRTLITTDGTTLLGADDKAGVSEIMTAVEQIITEKYFTATSGSASHRTKKSEAVLIYLTLTILKPNLPTPLTATTRAKLPMKTSMLQVLLLRSLASMSTLERQKIL